MSNFHTELIRRVRLDGIPARQQGTCKHVLGWIAFHASEEEADIAYPGIETLELETGMRAKAIVNATETLAAHEWITKKRRNGTSNIYRLNVRKLREHHVPKGPSKVTKLIDELPGLGFSHETDAGSDAEPNTGEPGAHTSENTHPQASDQHLCSENTSDVSSGHDGDVLTTPSGCSHDNQTVRDPSPTRQPTTTTAEEAAPTEPVGSSNAGWLEGSAEDGENNSGEASAGYVLLTDLGVKGTPRSQWSGTVTEALDTLGPDTVGTQLAGGATQPGPGAIVQTRLPGLKEQVVQARQKPKQAAAAAAWPDWCGSCLVDDRRYENANGAFVKCPSCHPYVNGTGKRDMEFLDSLAQMAGDAA